MREFQKRITAEQRHRESQGSKGRSKLGQSKEKWSLENFRGLSSTEKSQKDWLGWAQRGHKAVTASKFSNVGKESESSGREFPQQLQMAMRLGRGFPHIFNTKDLSNLMAYSNIIYNSKSLNSVETAKGLYYRN